MIPCRVTCSLFRQCTIFLIIGFLIAVSGSVCIFMLSYEMKFDLNDLFDHNDISYSNSSNPNIFDGPSTRIHQEEFQPNIEISNATSGKQNESYVSHSFSLTSINHNIFFV